MAVPRLRDERCFLELDPRRLDAEPRDAASIRGAAKHGRPVHPHEMPATPADWDLLEESAIEAIPILRRRREG